MTKKQPVLIILRGGPSSGKSTICQEIIKKDNKIVWLRIDSFKKFINSGNENRNRDHWYAAAAASADYFLSRGLSVIAECIFQYPKHVKLFLKLAKKHSPKVKIFELIARPGVLIKRDRQREGVPEGLRKPLPQKAIKNLSQLVSKNHFPGAEVIDTNKLSLKETVNKIWKEFTSS